ncbi:MAG: hypothetical protein WCF65_03115 [Parachlamydiaceae bacterium]
MKSIKLRLVLFFCLFSLSVFAREAHENTTEKQLVEIYVGLDELVFDSNGIYLIEGGELYPIKAVYSDAKGLYIKVHQAIIQQLPKKIKEEIRPKNKQEKSWPKSNECGNGHLVYHPKSQGGCGGCAHPLCIFRCPCHMPWNS